MLLGLAYQTGVLDRIVALVTSILGGTVRTGFRLWKATLSWAPWPILAALVGALLFWGISGEDDVPGIGLLCSLALLLVGAVSCLAYVYIDLERYDVSRGYKALHDPLKGQELAACLVRYGGRAGIPLLVVATVALVSGFALLNQSLYDTVGRGWYDLRLGLTREAELGRRLGPHRTSPAAAVSPDYADFLVYTLIHLFQIVDLLNIGGTYNLQISYVHQRRWPASTLLILFKSFFTLVLLQQIFASVRQMRLLGQTVRDFWSPHLPIREQARASLPQHGARVVRPLFASLKGVETLTPEQQDHVPQIIADIGSATIPVLIGHLHDPNENVRAIAASALGRLDALKALPRLALLAQDPSELVRWSVAEALGSLGSTATHLARRRRLRRWSPSRRRLPGWLHRLKSWARRERKFTPVELAVDTLRIVLRDAAAAVRKQAAGGLGRIGPRAAAATDDLIELLNDADESVRCEAARALGGVGGESEAAVAALTSLLKDPSTVVQTSAAAALGALKKEGAAAVPSLIPLLTDPSEQVRNTAAAAIGQIGTLPDEATPELVEGLTDADNVVRAQTAEALGTIGTPAADAVPALIKALGDANDRVRAKTAEALGKMGPAAAAAVPALVRALGDEDNFVRVQAVHALGEIGVEAGAAVPALVGLLGHANPQVRAGGAHALGQIKPPPDQILSGLLALAGDEDGEVRAQAVFALGAVVRLTEPAGRMLLNALQDSDPQVRSAGVEALGKHGELRQAACPALLALLGDSNRDVRARLAGALPQVAGAGQKVIDGLGRLLQDDEGAVQCAAAQALGKLGPAAAAAGPLLLQGVKAGEAAFREHALRAVVLIQPPEAVEAFSAGLKDPQEEVRKLATAGLMKAAAIPDEIVPDLVEALRDPEIQVRSNAAHALARLKSVPAEAVPLLVECLSNPDDGLRRNAVLALRAASPEAANRVVAGLLDDPNFRIRLQAAGWLLRENPDHPAAGQVLREALAQSALGYRKTAVEVIESLGSHATLFLEVCRERVLVEVEPEVRIALVQLVDRLSAGARVGI
jgi:HEAT repeat protein